jgi:hypothetical protein
VGRGNLCKSVDHQGWDWNPTTCTTTAIDPNQLFKEFSFSRRVHSWSPFVCDAAEHNITLGFLFNMQGVSPYGPWFDSVKSNIDLHGYPAPGVTVTIRDTFRKAQGPAIAPLIKAMGGMPHAITVNSAFWDIGRLVGGYTGRTGGVQTCNSSVLRREWVQSWARNASLLVDTIKELIPNTKYVAWRNANLITVPVPPCRTDMIIEMNAAAKAFSRLKGIHYIDYYSTPNITGQMRDAVHANANVNAIFMTKMITKIKRILNE